MTIFDKMVKYLGSRQAADEFLRNFARENKNLSPSQVCLQALDSARHEHHIKHDCEKA